MGLTAEEREFLDDLVYSNKFYFGRDKLWHYIRDNYDGIISRRQVAEYLSEQPAYQRTKPVKKREATSHINVAKEGLISLDLTGPFPTEKGGYQYIAGFLDVGTRRLFIKPLTKKTPDNLTKAFKEVVAENDLYVACVKCDNGSEMKGAFEKYLDEQGIRHFNTAPGQPWGNPIERYWRSMKQALTKYQISTGKKDWLEPCLDIVSNLNATWNRSLGCSANESAELPDEIKLERLRTYGIKKKQKGHRPNTNTAFRLNDTVRTYGIKKKQKGHRPNTNTAFRLNDTVRRRNPLTGSHAKKKETFSEQIYFISKVITASNSRLVSYKLADMETGFDIQGTYNVTDLILVDQYLRRKPLQLDPDEIQVGQRTLQSEREVRDLEEHTEHPTEKRATQPKEDGTYEVDKIISKKKFGKKFKYLVSWVGFDESFNTWEPIGNLFGCKELLADFNKK